MAKINLTPKKIYEQEFKTSMRGYDKKEVDEFLDEGVDWMIFTGNLDFYRQPRF